MQIKRLETDEEFLRLMPLVVEFSIRTKMPVYRHLREVASSVEESNFLTMFWEMEGNPIKYACGYVMDGGDFMITQALMLGKPQESQKFYEEFEHWLKIRGVKRILLMTYHTPRVFSKYGFKVQRLLMSKDLEKGGD